MKPANIKWSTYVDFDKENNNEDPKFKVGNHIKISKYKNIFGKGYVLNWSDEVFGIKKVKNTSGWIYIVCDLIKMLFRGHMLLVILTVKKLF